MSTSSANPFNVLINLQLTTFGRLQYTRRRGTMPIPKIDNHSRLVTT